MVEVVHFFIVAQGCDGVAEVQKRHCPVEIDERVVLVHVKRVVEVVHGGLIILAFEFYHATAHHCLDVEEVVVNGAIHVFERAVKVVEIAFGDAA